MRHPPDPIAIAIRCPSPPFKLRLLHSLFSFVVVSLTVELVDGWLSMSKLG